MIRIDLSIGDGWTIQVYHGESDFRKFQKYLKSQKHSDNVRLYEANESYGWKGANCSSTNVVYVADITNLPLLAHELIHAITWVSNTCGFNDSPLLELLAYTQTYCLLKIMKHKEYTHNKGKIK